MYNTQDLVGEVVTIKLNSGLEILSLLHGVDDDYQYLTLKNPRNLVINGEGGQLALVPYVFTATDEEIIMNASNVLSVNLTSETSKEDYIKIVETNESIPEEDTEDTDKPEE